MLRTFSLPQKKPAETLPSRRVIDPAGGTSRLRPEAGRGGRILPRVQLWWAAILRIPGYRLIMTCDHLPALFTCAYGAPG
jgi:hypothetical protein